MAKNGFYVKDKPSDYVIGMILHARDICSILAWHGTLFQLPFVKGMSLRTGYAHYGQPFLGPDGLILTLSGRTLKGSENNDLDDSPLTEDTITKHPNYATWLANTLYAGGEKESYAYKQVYAYNTLKDCDAHVNALPYTPGHNTRAPGSGIIPFPFDRKKRTRGGKRAVTPPSAPESSSRPSKAKKRTFIKLKKKRAASPEAEERPSKKAKKDRKGKGKMSKEHVNISEDEAADEDEAGTGGDYGLYDKSSYYDVSEDDLAKEEGGGVTESDAAKGEGDDRAGSDAPGEEGGEETEDDAAEEEGGEAAEDAKDKTAEEEGGEAAEHDAAEGDAAEDDAAEGDAAEDEAAEGDAAEEDEGEQARSDAGGEQAGSDPLQGNGNGDTSDDDNYDPSPSKPKRKKAAKRKGRAAGGSKGKGKARVKS